MALLIFEADPKPPLNLSFILSEMPREDGRSQTPASVAVSATPARPHVVVQFVKFGIVGVSNTLLTFLVFTVLLKGFHVWYLAASAIGFVVGATNGFLLNRRWTFREHVGDALTPVRWAIVQSSGLAINIGLLYVLVHEAGVDELLAQALTIGVVTVTTFMANRAWTFRIEHHDAARAVAEGDGAAELPTPVASAGAPLLSVEECQQREPHRDAPAAADQPRLER